MIWHKLEMQNIQFVENNTHSFTWFLSLSLSLLIFSFGPFFKISVTVFSVIYLKKKISFWWLLPFKHSNSSDQGKKNATRSVLLLLSNFFAWKRRAMHFIVVIIIIMCAFVVMQRDINTRRQKNNNTILCTHSFAMPRDIIGKSYDYTRYKFPFNHNYFVFSFY